jgi:hypothetical protein
MPGMPQPLCAIQSKYKSLLYSAGDQRHISNYFESNWSHLHQTAATTLYPTSEEATCTSRSNIWLPESSASPCQSPCLPTLCRSSLRSPAMQHQWPCSCPQACSSDCASDQPLVLFWREGKHMLLVKSSSVDFIDANSIPSRARSTVSPANAAPSEPQHIQLKEYKAQYPAG